MPNRVIPAPRGGWSQNSSLTEPLPYTAEVLDNWFPTAEGIQMRRGHSLHATIGASVVTLMAYSSGSTQELFAADANNIYDITSPADPAVAPTADVSSLTSGDWTAINFGTSGGNFLFIANGADSIRHYNGTTWATPTINNVTSSDISHVWEYGQRIWMVEDGKLVAWYLPVSSIAGDATEFPLYDVFTLGGSLLFGASWSPEDAGEGLSDLNVFVTTEGEIAVYSGTTPASAVKVGVYRVARPLSKQAFFRAGGDIAIATEDGIVSLSAAVQQDRTALSRQAITYPIEDKWREVVSLRDASHAFNTTIWQSETLLIVSVPDSYSGEKQAYVCNARTGAWCRFTGWDVQCSAVHDDNLYFGGATSQIYLANTTGADNGAPYCAYWLPKFERAPGGEQMELLQARVVYRGNMDLCPEMTGAVDYDTGYPGTPAVCPLDSSNLWGTAVWGSGRWGSEVEKTPRIEWESVSGLGQSSSCWLGACTAKDETPFIDVISLEYTWNAGALI